MGAYAGMVSLILNSGGYPKAGELFLGAPPFFITLLHPNLVDVPRLSISFKLGLRNKANYL
ncbi:MAG: hypothetical protein CM15mP100_3440 [Alphaproteobacteria bacterium]|nr:MAG: hypothetical protein CM15mP100_3440 [Alphaproteobacteria bacterium]